MKAILMQNLCIVVSCFLAMGGFSRGGILGVSAKFAVGSFQADCGVHDTLVAVSALYCVIFAVKELVGCVQPIPRNS
eukprot:15366815-Ditylum_brightwellii.AAC.3